MKKPLSGKELAVDILSRSTCNVQVGCAIEDNHGIFAWGWNSVGNGLGLHAEAHALQRANKERLTSATIYIASRRKKNGKVVISRPCDNCLKRIVSWDIAKIVWRDSYGRWITERLYPADTM